MPVNECVLVADPVNERALAAEASACSCWIRVLIGSMRPASCMHASVVASSSKRSRKRSNVELKMSGALNERELVAEASAFVFRARVSIGSMRSAFCMHASVFASSSMCSRKRSNVPAEHVRSIGIRHRLGRWHGELVKERRRMS